MPRAFSASTASIRAQQWAARALDLLPASAQVRLSGRPPVQVDGDILGAPSNLPWAVRYTSPNTFAPHADPAIAYQPANAYELIAALILFGIVLLVLRSGARPGTAGGGPAFGSGAAGDLCEVLQRAAAVGAAGAVAPELRDG